MLKVNSLWRMVAMFCFGIIIGAFVASSFIISKLDSGQTITIGKIKIKNSTTVDIPLSQQSEEIEKPKRKKIFRWRD